MHFRIGGTLSRGSRFLNLRSRSNSLSLGNSRLGLFVAHRVIDQVLNALIIESRGVASRSKLFKLFRSESQFVQMCSSAVADLLGHFGLGKLGVGVHELGIL